MNRFLKLLVSLVVVLGFSSSVVAAPEVPTDPRPGCFSCLIKVDKLDPGVPTSLAGTWLFTREDNYDNPEVDTDTTNWKLVQTPGTWSKVYDDGKPFVMGWYRGVIEVPPELIGKDVVVLVSSKLAKALMFVDGIEKYRRPERLNVDRYFANQPIPFTFKISKPRHVIAFRFESLTEDGLYELPFEIRRYDTNDTSLGIDQFRGGEFRVLSGAITFFFGIFFFLIFAKIRVGMYLTAALASVAATPYLILPTDVMLRFFDPEKLLLWHYVGMICVYLFYVFCQHFDKFTPKLNWLFGVLVTAAIGAIVYNAFLPVEEIDLVLFKQGRQAIFFLNLVMVALSIFHTARGALAKKEGALVLCLGMLAFAGITLHDGLMVIGMITSTGMVPFDTMIFLAAMIYVASSTFANTFKDNKRLVTDLKGINDNLENIVNERTLQLRQKTNDIQTMLQNMPQGILTIVSGETIHPEYSSYLEEIFETKDIAGKKFMDLVFSNSNIGSDALSQVDAAVAACIGEDRMNFDFNTHLMVTELEKDMGEGRKKSLELSWSPICNESDTVEKLMVCVRDVTELKQLAAEAGQQKRELDMIGQILLVNQEKFHEFIDSSSNFIQENESLLLQARDKDPDLITQLFRNMHTIKGNARTYGLLHLTNIVHEAEQAYDELRQDPEKEFNKEELLEQLKGALTAIQEYAELNEIKLGRKGPGRRGSAEKFVMVKKEHIQQMLDAVGKANSNGSVADPTALLTTLKQLGYSLRTIGTEPITTILDGVFASLPSLAKELEKEAPTLVVNDNGIVIPNQVADLLRNVFMHLYRNSMDHGIEPGAARVAKGKPAAGTIQLDLNVENNKLVMRLHDDGKGLAVAFIRKKAVEKGLIPENSDLPQDAIAQLIFASGFSTAEVVTEVSGRGVGMDAVREFVERENGNIELRFTDSKAGEDFRAFETVISLPGHFAVTVA